MKGGQALLSLLLAGWIIATAEARSVHNPKTAEQIKALSHHARHHYKEIASEMSLLAPHNIRVGGGSAASFSTIAPLVISNNDVVNVSYTSTAPASGDWIGAYSPAGVDITKTVPVKFGFADASPDYLSTGKGTLQFNMTNLRSDIRFYFFRGNLSHPILTAASTVNVTFANPNQPVRPRIVATGDRNVLALLWSSATSTAPTLQWGTAPGTYTTTVSATTAQIAQAQMCGGVANSTGWRDPGLVHTAQLVGMEALATRKVYYRFGDAATSDYSPEHTLLVPPLPGVAANAGRPTTAVLFCDLGRGSSDDTFTWDEYGRPALNTSNSIGSRVAKGEVDVIFHGGDVSYACGFSAVWDFFLNMMSSMASGALYLTTVGNHESDWPGSPSYYTGTDSGGECGVMSTTLLPMPVAAAQQAQRVNEPWWSYEVGLLHLIGLSSEHNFTLGSPQYLWFEQDLKSVDRSQTPWVVLNLHRAMYINSYYGGKPSSDLAVMDLMLQNLEPLLWKYKVNLAFYGHDHVMQRQAAVYQQQVVQLSEKRTVDGETVNWHANPQATVHMVVGSAGANFTHTSVTPPPAWNEATVYVFGYAVATAVNASYLDWQFVSSDTNQVLDRMVITQNVSQPWVLPASAGSAPSGGTNSSLLLLLLLLLLIPAAAAAFWMYRVRSERARKDQLVIPLLWDDKAEAQFNATAHRPQP